MGVKNVTNEPTDKAFLGVGCSREILVKRAASELESNIKVSSGELGLCISHHGSEGGFS